MKTISSTRRRSGVQAWWESRSKLEKWLLSILGCAGLCAAGGALVYAIATGGVVVASGGTVLAVGKAATVMAVGLA